MFRAALDTFSADEILGMIGRSRASGALRVFGPHTLGAVYCHEGAVTFATTDDAEDLLAVLGRAGFVRDVSGIANATALAESLMNSSVDMQRLHDFVRHRTEESVFEMSLWDDGELQFDAGEDHRFGDAFSYQMSDVIDSVIRRRAQWVRFIERLPSVDTVVAQVAALPGEEGDLTISRTQWRVLAAVDGRRSIGQLASALGTGLFSTMQLLISLLDGGLIAVVEGAVVEEPLSVVTSRPAVQASVASPAAQSPAGSGITYDPAQAARNLATVGGGQGAAADSGPRDTPATVAGHLGLPPVEFIDSGERPSRELILRLLSAVKEL